MAKKKVKTKTAEQRKKEVDRIRKGPGKEKAKKAREKLIKYAKENPLEAASLVAMGIPVIGWGAAGALRGAAIGSRIYKAGKVVAKKAGPKVTKAAKTVGGKLKRGFGPKHKKAGKVYSTKRGAEMGRAGSKKHTVVRKKDKVTTGYKGKKTVKKQYGVEPTGKAAATSKKALFAYGAAGYVGSQLMSDKTSDKPKKKTNGKGPGSVISQQGKDTGSYKDRDSAGPNAIARPIKRPRPKRKPQGPRKYAPGTDGGDRPTSKAGPHLSEIFRRRLGGQRNPKTGRSY